MSEQKLKMKFDMNTIKHLGVNLYSTLPPILSELIANAWDADATEVNIYFNDKNNKNIIIEDNENGMTFNEINDHFLMIGRNRRKLFDLTNLGRKAIGKKGLGKLSIFGVANKITIETTKNKKMNKFILDFNEMLNLEETNEYEPKILVENKKTSNSNGTKIYLEGLKRKSHFDIEGIAINLAKTFNIFTSDDQKDIPLAEKFVCKLIYNNDKEFLVEKKLKYDGINYEFKWEYPNNFEEIYNSNNRYAKFISGTIMTNKKPLKAEQNGISLFSRGKLVQNNTFFENRANDQAHQYMVGFFNVDFIDEYNDEELISTDRKSLTWENEALEDLRELMNQIIKKVANEWKTRREELKKKEILDKYGVNLDTWVSSLDKVDQNLAKKLTKSIMGSNLDVEEATELAVYVKDMFNFKSFKNYATEILDDGEINPNKLIKFFKDWELVEATELANLAKTRLVAIEGFEKLIKENAREVPEIHNFLKKFPWLLDPRIVEFRDEITYAQLLKENFKNEDLDSENKRIDFLCHSSGETLYVIEIKRPKVKVGKKQLDQLKEYLAFIEDKVLANSETSFKNVIGYIVSNELDNSTLIKRELENSAGYFYFRRYDEMLATSKKYHQEFINKKEELESRDKTTN